MPILTKPAAQGAAGDEPPQGAPRTRQVLLDPARVDSLAPMFKALGDPVRLRLLSLIATADGGEACVYDLTAGFKLSTPTISHHLKVLRRAGLVGCDRRGTWVYYRLLPAAGAALGALLDAGASVAAA